MKRTILNLFALTLIVGGATHLNAQYYAEAPAVCCEGGGMSCCGGSCSAGPDGCSAKP
jgi:hypothetical protein